MRLSRRLQSSVRAISPAESRDPFGCELESFSICHLTSFICHFMRERFPLVPPYQWKMTNEKWKILLRSDHRRNEINLPRHWHINRGSFDRLRLRNLYLRGPT